MNCIARSSRQVPVRFISGLKASLQRHGTALALGIGLVTALVHGPAFAVTQSFTTAGATTFTVPASVTSLAVVATGGAGGAGGCCNNIGGNGGVVTVTLPVNPGQILNLFIGGGGTKVSTPASGGGGGGSTTINPGAVNQIVAGGGGGGGGPNGSSGGNGNGGIGAGPTAGAGGLGGVGGAAGFPGGSAGGNGNGGPGGSAGGAGGVGVAQAGIGGSAIAGSFGAGGGGGGGYGGGGGGGGAPDNRGSGGGGGGSVGPAGAGYSVASNAVINASGGAGSIVFTYFLSNVITFPTPADTALTSGPVALSATASSNLPVSYASNSPAVCTVAGSSVTLLTAGVCSITASQAGDGTYPAAAPVTRTFNVLKGDQTINFTQPADTAVSAGPVTLVATASSGLTVGFVSNSTAICTVSGTSVTLVSVGVCSITASQAGDSNYNPAFGVARTFNVTQNANVITFPTPADTALTSGPVTLTATASSGLPVSYASNSPAVCTVAGSSVTLLTAGVCSITANQAGNASFAAASPVTRTFNVLKAAQTLTFPAQVPATQSFVAGGTFAINPLATSAAPNSGNPIVYSSLNTGVCTVSGTTVTIVTTGSCVLAADQAGNANYNASAQVQQSVAIGAAPQSITSFVATPTNPVFAPNGTFTVSATGGASGNAVTFTVATASAAVCRAGGTNGATITTLAAGTCTVLANQAGNANFASASQATLAVVIGAAPAVVPAPTVSVPTTDSWVLWLMAALMAGLGFKAMAFSRRSGRRGDA